MITGSAAPGSAWSLAGRGNILAYARQMIERAQSEVALIVGEYRTPRVGIGIGGHAPHTRSILYGRGKCT